jgi:hypothetical protein
MPRFSTAVEDCDVQAARRRWPDGANIINIVSTKRMLTGLKQALRLRDASSFSTVLSTFSAPGIITPRHHPANWAWHDDCDDTRVDQHWSTHASARSRFKSRRFRTG